MADNPSSLGLKRRRKVGRLDDVRLIHWRAIDAAQEVLYKAAELGNLAVVLTAVHAINQAAIGFAKLEETAELQRQIDALRTELDQLRDSAQLRRVI